MPERIENEDAARRALVGLQMALVPVLVGWSKGVAGANGREIDADTCEVYAEALAGIRITVDELRDARQSMLRSSRFFPTVAEIVSHVQGSRVGRRYEGFVEALLPDGNTVLCDPDNAHDGRYLPEGGGNRRPLRPMGQYADLVADIHERRDELGGVRSLAEIGERASMAPSLPSRGPVDPEESERLIELARDTAEARRSGAS